MIELPRFDLLDLSEVDEPADPADEHRYCLHAHPRLCTPFDFLYGGTGIAASAEAAERASRRPLQWITTQFVGAPAPGSDLDVEVRIAAAGRASAQTAITIRDAPTGEPMVQSLAAHNARPADRLPESVGPFATMPSAPEPDECAPFGEPFEAAGRETFFDHLDRRVALGSFGGENPQPQSGQLAMWTKIVGGEIGSAATQGFVGDVGPLTACARLGLPLGGTSLDNTIRIVDAEPTEWVLLEMELDGFARSVAHTTVRAWSEDGRLLGIAQQSAIIRTSHHQR